MIENGVVTLFILILLALISVIVIILVLDTTSIRKVTFKLLKVFSIEVEK